MKIKFLPSTFDENGSMSRQQHLPCFVIDDCMTVDAGSLALAATDEQRKTIRDIVVTHPHLDHIATLPSFIDDLFAELETPLKVHGTRETIDALEKHIFNWTIFPRFAELKNDYGLVMEYVPFEWHEKFAVKHLSVVCVPVSHQIQTIGVIISDDKTTVAFTSDTAATEAFWDSINNLPQLDALFIECAFPDRHAELAHVSQHLTPRTMKQELAKLRQDSKIYVINIKPMYRAEVVTEIESLSIPNLEILEVGKLYEI